MFARAYMSKQTAFIDIALFGLLLIGLRIDSILAIGLGIMTVGMMGVLKIANAPDMMTPVSGKYIVAIGLVVAILGIFKMLSKKNTAQGNLKNKNRLLTYILTRVASFVAIVIVFKGPNVMINQINAGTFSP